MYKKNVIAEKNAACKVMYIKDQKEYKKYRMMNGLERKYRKNITKMI